MPLIKKLLIAILAIVAVLYTVSFFFPSKWSVKRSISINGSAEKIFLYVNDLHKWGQWYPWTKKTDVSMVITYDGPETGEGSIRRWSGSSIKSGEVKIVKSEKNHAIRYTFISERSSMVVNGSIIIQEATRDNRKVSEVIWEDSGDSGFNFFTRFLSGGLDKVIGKQFEDGLLALKTAVESTK